MANLNVKYTEEKDFFKIGDSTFKGKDRLPMTPWVLIQFRTSVFTGDSIDKYVEENLNSYNIDTDSTWTTVSYRKADMMAAATNTIPGGSIPFDNYFEGLELTDNGGLLKCTVKLYDRDFEGLEDILLSSIATMKMGNAVLNKTVPNSNDKALYQINAGKPQNLNFRIRFGYADKTGDDIIDDNNFHGSEFSRRTDKNNMVVRSPWLYFQMMDCKFKVVTAGLNATVEGISVGNSLMNNYKIVNRFVQLKGTPDNVLKNLGEDLYFASGGAIIFADESGKAIGGDIEMPEGFDSEIGLSWPVMSDDALKNKYTDGDGVLNTTKYNIATSANENMKTLTISLGSEPVAEVDKYGKPTGREVISFMSIKQLLTKFTAQVPPKFAYKDNNGEWKEITNKVTMKTIMDGSEKFIETPKDGKREVASLKRLPYTYSQLEHGDKDNRLLFIRFFYKSPKNAISDKIVTRKYSWGNNENNLITNFSIDSAFDFAQMSQSVTFVGNGTAEAFGFQKPEANGSEATAKKLPPRPKMTLTTNIVENKTAEDGDTSTLAVLAAEIQDNMNSGVFRGTITIPGDPYYLFEGALQPYSFGIYIEVSRRTDNKKSYLSGFYYIKNISHSLGKSGFSTTLTLERFGSDDITLKKV